MFSTRGVLAAMKPLGVLVLLVAMLVPTAASAAPSSTTVPRIDSVSPSSAVRGTIVEARGGGFGGGRKVRVTVGTTAATVLDATGTRVRFRVPEAAPLGTVSVTITSPSGLTASRPMAVIFDGVVHPTLDTARGVAETIGSDGGALVTTTAGGVTLTLSIRAGALAAPTPISLTPVAAITDLPLSGGLAAAAHFEPSGLVLDVPATLTIEFPTPPSGLAGFRYAGEGRGFTIVPATLVGSTVTMEVDHFSGEGTGVPVPADFDALVAQAVASVGPLTLGQILSLADLVVTWEALFGADFCESKASCGSAMQTAADALAALGNTACATGHADLTTALALTAAADSLRLLVDYEAIWDRLRLLDEYVGSGVTAPDSLPIDSNGQTSAPECRKAILERVIVRAIALAEVEPFGNAAAASEEKSNVAWLFDLGALAQLLGLDDASTDALQAAETIVADLISGPPAPGAAANALDDPFGEAPSTAQKPFVLARANFDNTGGIDNLEWLHFLGVQAGTLDSGDVARAGVEAALNAIIERGAALCLTDVEGGRGHLNQGRNFRNATGILPALDADFVAAIEACPVRITISPTTVTADAGSQQQFTAIVTGATDTSVTWSSSDAAAPVDGLFTVPMTPGTYHVTAASAAHPSRTAEAIVTANSTSTVDVDVTPDAPGAVRVGDTIQFSVAVTGDPNTAVTWTATGGTVSSSGLFTATTAGLGSVTATSQADADAAETVAVEVTAAPITVTVTPTSLQLAPGGTASFSATVTGADDTSVTWTATGGLIDQDGTYTAGSSPGQFSVRATSVAGPSASASVTITPAFIVFVDDGWSRTSANAFAQALSTTGEYPAPTGGCTPGNYHATGGPNESTSFSCAVANDNGDQANADATASSSMGSMSVTLGVMASHSTSLTTADSPYFFRAEASAQAMSVLHFTVTETLDYALSATPSVTNNCPSSLFAGAFVGLQLAYNGTELPATGTLNPGTVYHFSARADTLETGADIDLGQSCSASAQLNATLAVTQPNA